MTKYLLKINDIAESGFYSNERPGYLGDSGVDLYHPEDLVIPANNISFVSLKISCEMIKVKTGEACSYYLYPRSSISKTPLILANSVGVIDSGYRGEIIAAVRNLSSSEYHIKKGDRLFQICAPDLSYIKYVSTNELSSSHRGSSGFGSTGH